MNIVLNNRPEYFNANTLTINEVLQLKKYTFKMMVIKVNGKLIRKPDRDSTKVQDGDKVEIIHMISGG